MKRIFIAASSEEAELARAKHWIARAEAAGIKQTFDWIAGIGADVDGLARIAQISEMTPRAWQVKRAAAEADLDGIIAAEAFWLLAPEHNNRTDAWVELGIAIGIRRVLLGSEATIIISGPRASAGIFTSLAPIICETDELAFKTIRLHNGRPE